MERSAAFSLCEFLVAFGLAIILFAGIAQGFLVIQNFQIFNLAATRDLLRMRYFLEVECPEILRKKKEANHLSEESFFVVESQGLREISKSQWNSGKGWRGDMLELHCEVASDTYRKSSLLPVRLQFHGDLPGGKRRTYEIQGMFFLF